MNCTPNCALSDDYRFVPPPGPPRTYHNSIASDASQGMDLSTSRHHLGGQGTGRGIHTGETLTQQEVSAEAPGTITQSLKWLPPPPSAPPKHKLSRPVIIPQVRPTDYLEGASPFMRAYAPCLATHNVSPITFLSFIDNLNVAQAGAPRFQALSEIGEGLGYVPEAISQSVGAGIELVSGIAGGATAIVRSKRLLKKVNKEFFAPRGLKVDIKKDKYIQGILGHPVDHVALPAMNEETIGMTVGERRLSMLADYVAPLTTDVPELMIRQSWLDKMSSKQVNRQIQREREKVAKEHRKTLGKHGLGRSHSSSSSSSGDERSERKREEKGNKKVGKWEWIVIENL